MNVFLLIIAIIAIYAVLKKIALMEALKITIVTKEIRKNLLMMPWAIFLVICILFIPYQVWVLTGSSNDWDGVYIIGATILVTIVLCFTAYSKFKGGIAEIAEKRIKT
ncbi:hypothetical protein RJD24_10290 [Bacillaceae bacterium IKA-2]|nr:hypothetical protein RJD24_10290 [Bacillaceae bacterium IKA-2]